MAELPTEKELKKLYDKKGSNALTWYAWRNALRALPVLSRLPLRDVWQDDVVRHTFAVCRANLLLVNVEILVTDAITVLEAVTAAGIAADTASIAACTAATGIATETNASSALYAYVYAAAGDASRVAEVAARADADGYAYSAAKADYDFLIGLSGDISQSWFDQPLWPKIKGLLGAETTKPDGFDADCEKLTSALHNIGLDFVATDLNKLWSGNITLEQFKHNAEFKHWKNYLNGFSRADLNDPVALRRLILEGEAAEHIHAVRVLLLGPGGAGKSSLADRLHGKPVQEQKKLTPGVEYFGHQPLDLYETFGYLQQGDKPLDLYLWDFGGQTIFHGLHSAFLHENCVYVLVVDSRHEQAPDEWLHQIRHLAGNQAQVLLVTNWYEQCETRQNQARLLREFPDLLSEKSFFYFSCHDPNAAGFKDFVIALEQASLDSQRMVLKETLDVNEALQQQYQDDVFLESADLDDVIEQITDRPDALDVLPNKLEQLGFLVRVDGDDQHYCLKPAWAVDHAYAVLYSPLLRDAKGVLSLKTLQREFKEKIKTRYMTHLVEFLQERSLCKKLNSGDGYFFPDAARADELPEASELLGDMSNGLLIRFDLPYLPLGFHAALVHRLFGANGIRHTDDIWRQGFILRQGNSYAVIHYLTRKNVVELKLTGEWQDYSGLLNLLLVNLKTVLLEGKTIREEQIVPSVVLNKQVFSVHSAEKLVEVLGQINSYGQLIREVKAMASKINVKASDGSQVAINAKDVTQKYNSDNTTLDISSDQRQQLALVVEALLNDASNLAKNPEALAAVAQVNRALAAAEDSPEERKLLSKVWDGIKEFKEAVEVGKTGAEIADFVVQNQAAIATAITAAVAIWP